MAFENEPQRPAAPLSCFHRRIEKQRGRGATLNWPATPTRRMRDVSLARQGTRAGSIFPWRSVRNRAQPRLGLLPVDDEA
jgi:hypothetical protein